MFTLAGITLLPSLLAATAILSSVYIICLIVGGGLLAISTIFGHDTDADVDADVGMDFHADVDADADLDAGGDFDVHADADADAAHVGHAAEGVSLASWFSIRFLVYFMATFGAVGTVLTFLTPTMGTGSALAAAVIAGLVVGQGVHQTLRYLQRTSGDSTADVADFIDKSARVTIAIDTGKRGEVALQVRGRERFVAATAKRAEDQFKIGDRAVVVSFANGQAQIISQDEYEFLHEHERGAES